METKPNPTIDPNVVLQLKQQQKQQDESTGLMFTQPLTTMSYDTNFLHYSLDTEEILEKLEHFFKSEYYNKRTKTWQCKGESLMNDTGINYIKSLIRGFIGKEIVLSNFSEEEIPTIMIGVADLVNDELYLYWEKFGLAEKDNPDVCDLAKVGIVYETTIINVEAALKRAINGFTFKGIRTVYKAEDKTGGNITPPSQSKGLLSTLNPFKI